MYVSLVDRPSKLIGGNKMVSTASIVVIIINMILGIVFPTALCIFYKKKYNTSLKAFWIGAAVMLVFALILESGFHQLVLRTPIGITIFTSPVWYCIYGGLAAGIFEECGRFLAMKFVLKKEQGNNNNALMYGAGHGGFEAFFLLSIGQINNLIYSFAINAKQTELLTGPLDEANKVALEQIFDELINSSPVMFLVSPIERIAAIAAQIALSVLVWTAVKYGKNKIGLLFLAILLHASLDTIPVLFKNLCGLKGFVLEGIVYVLAIAIVLISRCVWKKNLAEQR